MPGRFIALEGPDGVGKTSLAHRLADLDYETATAGLARAGGAGGLVFVPRRQISATSTYAATLMEHLSTMLWHSGDAPDLSDAFWVSLQAAWFTAHSETVVGPLLAAGFDVVVDGWLYKFFAKLLLQGFTEADLAVIFNRVSTPDTVLLLQADVAALYHRRNDFRLAELGMHADYGEPSDLGRDTFIDYQTKTARNLRMLAGRYGWHTAHLDPGESVQATAERLAPIIAELRTPPPARPDRLGTQRKGPPMTATSALAAHGGTKALDIHTPHYRWPAITTDMEGAVLAQLHRSLSDRDASGVIGEFETAFAQFVGTPYAVSFASGTSAIHAMSRIAGLRPGDAVIAPAYTFLATATPFAYDGIEVRFADADEFGNVTAATLATQLTPAVRAVIVTHMWGNPCPMSEIVEFCRANKVLLLEDCSHAHFASWQGQRVGTFGDMAVFSFNQKAITTGEGGALTTENNRFRELALLFGHYNKRSQREIDPTAEYYPFAFTGMGLKHRITTLGAAIGIHQLKRAANIETRRRTILTRYRTGLAGNPVITPAIVPEQDGQHGLYVLGLRFHPENASVSRDEFVALCRAEGAVEVDAPGSTRDISTEPLFARRDPFAPWVPSTPQPTQLPGVAAFQDSFVKIPLWGYEGDESLVAGYLDVLAKVSAAVAR